MLDPIGTIAVRNLTSDIANLTGRLAVMSGVLEQLVAISDEINPNAWQHEQINGDGGQNGYITTMSGEETDKLRTLLAYIEAMK